MKDWSGSSNGLGGPERLKGLDGLGGLKGLGGPAQSGKLLDPTRIPEMMAMLQRAWEAQPGVPLAQLWAQLESVGVGFNSTDEELKRGCEQLLAVHPASVGDVVSVRGEGSAAAGSGDEVGFGAGVGAESGFISGAGQAILVECVSPARHLTLSLPNVSSPASPSSGTRPPDVGSPAPPHPVAPSNGGLIAVRGRDLQPVVWSYAQVLRCHVGFPVIVEDESGVRHRLGVASRLTVADFYMTGDSSLSGLTRAELAGAEYLVELEDGTVVQVDHRLRLYSPHRRELQVSQLRWVVLEQCEVSKPLVVAAAGGGIEKLSAVTAITRAR